MPLSARNVTRLRSLVGKPGVMPRAVPWFAPDTVAGEQWREKWLGGKETEDIVRSGDCGLEGSNEVRISETSPSYILQPGTITFVLPLVRNINIPSPFETKVYPYLSPPMFVIRRPLTSPVWIALEEDTVKMSQEHAISHHRIAIRRNSFVMTFS